MGTAADDAGRLAPRDGEDVEEAEVVEVVDGRTDLGRRAPCRKETLRGFSAVIAGSHWPARSFRAMP